MDRENTFCITSNYEKLLWLIKLRFLLILLITALSGIFYLQNSSINYFHKINPTTMLLINSGAIIINLFFYLDLQYIIEKKRLIINDEYFNYLGFLQIDFDIIYIISVIILTGNIESPFLLLLFYNIITSSFIIKGKISYIYSFLTLILLLLTRIHLIVLPEKPFVNLCFSEFKLKTVYIAIIYLFAVYIAKYVSNKIDEKQEELNELYQKTYQISITDRLTGLYDQTYFRMAAQDAIDIARENNSKLAIVMIDLDNFKHFNDSNGHLLGSKALQDIADIMRSVFRKTDLKAKYGGDEFIILMRDIDEEYIETVINRFRNKILNHDFAPGREYNQITASIGVSFFPRDGKNISELIDNADKALYYVKNRGKNQLMFFYNIE